METLEKLSKELKVIELTEVALVDNVRHKHLWHLKSYNPTNINHYNMEDIVRMAITIIDNIIENKPPFDNEPAVWFNETTEYYEVQTGNTRAITLSYLQEIVNKNVERFEEVFTDEEIEKALENCHTGNFAVINRELTESEKRRENNTRSEQHWLSTALGYYSSIHNGMNVKKLASQEGVSVKKVLELSNLNRLPAKAKKLCLDNIINEKVAIALSKLDKADISLVVDHILEKEYEKVESPRMLMSLLENSYDVLEEDYPFEAFETENRKYLHVEMEPWYIRIEDGMFVKHLSKDAKASNFRRDIYWNTIHTKLLKEYPEAKVLKSTKGMTVTSKRECLDAKPYINKDKIVFGCKSDSCEVHGFKVEFDVEKKKEKIDQEYRKQILHETFKVTDDLLLINGPNATLNNIALDFSYLRLNAKDKEVVRELIKAYCVGASVSIDDDFLFKNLIGDTVAMNKICVEKFELIMHHMSLLWLKSNKFMYTYLDSYFAEYDYNLEDLYDASHVDKEVESVENKHTTKLEKNVSRENTRRNELCDFLVHAVGINNEFPKTHMLKCDIATREDYVELIPWNECDIIWIACRLNIFKNRSAGLDSDLEMVEILNIINTRINEYAPFCKDYWNQPLEDEYSIAEHKHASISRVKDMLYSHFNENTDLFFKGKSGYDIVSEACEMVDVAFATETGNKKLACSKIDESRNEYTWRIADVGLNSKQIEEIISWYVPNSRIQKLFK